MLLHRKEATISHLVFYACQQIIKIKVQSIHLHSRCFIKQFLVVNDSRRWVDALNFFFPFSYLDALI